jgi:hypothetical protein
MRSLRLRAGLDSQGVEALWGSPQPWTKSARLEIRDASDAAMERLASCALVPALVQLDIGSSCHWLVRSAWLGQLEEVSLALVEPDRYDAGLISAALLRRRLLER